MSKKLIYLFLHSDGLIFKNWFIVLFSHTDNYHDKRHRKLHFIGFYILKNDISSCNQHSTTMRRFHILQISDVFYILYWKCIHNYGVLCLQTDRYATHLIKNIETMIYCVHIRMAYFVHKITESFP